LNAGEPYNLCFDTVQPFCLLFENRRSNSQSQGFSLSNYSDSAGSLATKRPCVALLSYKQLR
jgi:hypothetical protein